jgi:hypothetical protein
MEIITEIPSSDDYWYTIQLKDGRKAKAILV